VIGRFETNARTTFALVAVGYAVLAFSSYELFGALTIGVTFFPPAGLTFASLLLLNVRRWPIVVAAIVVAEMFVNVVESQPFWWSLGWAAANVAEPLAGALVVRRMATHIELTPRFARAFLVGGLAIGPSVGATIGATVLSLSGDLAWIDGWPDIWVGDALGVLVVAPLILSAARDARRLASPRRTASVVGVLVGLVAIAVLFFLVDEIPYGYLAIPLLAFAAVRLEPLGLAVTAAVLASVSTAATAHGRGPWSPEAGAEAQDQLGSQQFFLLMSIGGAWILALEVRRRLDAVRRSADAQRELEHAAQRDAERAHLDAMNDVLVALASAATIGDVVEIARRFGRSVVGAQAMVLGLVRGEALDDDDVPADADDEAELHIDIVARDGDVAGACGAEGADLPERLIRARLDGASSGAVDDMLGADATGWMVVPVRSDERVFGAAWFARPAPWTDTARLRAVSLLGFVGSALERVEAAERDRRVARALQRAHVPRTPLTAGRIEVAGEYHPATSALDIGGDWYDVTEQRDGTVRLMVGDVVGHGLSAAAAMGQLKSAARALSAVTSDPAELVTALDLVAADTPDGRMATVVYATFDERDLTLRYCIAGHPPPVVRGPDGTARLLEAVSGPPLSTGAAPRTAGSEVLMPGSTVVLYTDGLIDWHGSSIDERLGQLVSALEEIPTARPAAVAQALVERMTSPRARADDVAVLCMSIGDDPR
jgi:integral membrane sensor domain MASE1